MPAQDFIYLGDTARLPYGTKSADTVSRYSLQCAQALLERGIGEPGGRLQHRLRVGALGALRARYPELPVIGVIEPGAEAAVAASPLAAHRGDRHRRHDQRRRLSDRDSPPQSRGARAGARLLHVRGARRGGLDRGPVAEGVAHRYLDPLVRGRRTRPTRWCSAARISRSSPRPSARCCRRRCASSTRRRRPRTRWRREWRRSRTVTVCHAIPGRIAWLATDDAERFARVGGRFFGSALSAAGVEIIDL